jgi:hypothetical protein
MATPPSIQRLLEEKRRALAQLQEDIAALERAQALLRDRSAPRPTPVPPATPSPAPAGRPPAAPLRERVLAIFRDRLGPQSPRALRAALAAQGTPCHRETLRKTLNALIAQRAIRRVGPGLYQRVLTAGAAAPASNAAASPSPTPAPPRPAAAPAARPKPARRASRRR